MPNRVPVRYADWEYVKSEAALRVAVQSTSPAQPPTELFPYFSWSSPEVLGLADRLESELQQSIVYFEVEKDLYPNDPDERSINRAWCEEFVRIVDPWCQILDLDPTDLPKYDKARRQSVWNEDLIRPDLPLARIRELLSIKTGDGILRPRCLESASVEMMKWLARHPNDVDRVHPRTFEAIVAELIRDAGWTVTLTKRTRDGGIDILCMQHDATGNTIKMVVEVKLYNLSRSVGLATVDRIAGVAAREKAARAMVVTNSRFSRDAWRRWEHEIGRHLTLADRTELFTWLGRKDMQ